MRAVEARGRDRGNYGSAGARDDRRLLLFLARRLAWAAVVVLAIAVIDFALIRVLQPQLDPAHGVGDEVVNDLGRAFLHPQRGRWRRSPRSRAVLVVVTDLVLSFLDPRGRAAATRA